MEKIIAYKSNNGRLFETKEKCLAYENKIAQFPKVTEITTQALGKYLVGGKYVKPDIVKHVIMKQEKPYSNKVFETYYIIGGRYKFVDIFGVHEHELMGTTMAYKPSMSWHLAAGYLVQQILEGHELTDEYLSSEIDKINGVNGIYMLAVNVIESERKWEIDNPKWKSGIIRPYTFTIEKMC